ncbi:MAG: hypothetical protein ACTSPK_00025 [Candidatus Heimdallarchaeota archaeon]
MMKKIKNALDEFWKKLFYGTYVCAMCNKEYIKQFSKKKQIEQYNEEFPYQPYSDDLPVVCDFCYNKMNSETTTAEWSKQEYEQSKRNAIVIKPDDENDTE